MVSHYATVNDGRPWHLRRIAISEYAEVHEVRGAIKLLILTTVKVRGVDGNQEASAGEAQF